ncbi:hypothetical protein B0H21DRAFT_777314 [Amylocystis lapponica]|nr:hypothetical protein B0H21DRAFT_777314 [Amylocystis lapponica]
MQSLRQRKPSESRSRGSQSGKRLAKSGPKDSRKSTRVDDKIKKRMSMRYADISSPTNAAVPPVPSLPIGVPSVPVREPSGGYVDAGQQRDSPKAAELRLLDQDSFDPEEYLKLKLANSTEAEIKTLQSSLQAQKDDVALDLQRDVFKNYAEFVQVSKEVSILENEMLEFKECLAEWKSMPSLLHIEESSSAAERRRNVRSSVADLRVLYANQMQNLHAQIEGSSKFVPTTPGRHVISDDKLVAERCWPLTDMMVLDTKDTATMSNVFKIRQGKETHVYRTEVAAEKKHLLSQFRQVAEELAAKKRKEREGEHLRRKTLFVAGDRKSFAFGNDEAVPTWMTDLMGQTDMGASAKEKVERDARWISDFSDDLTVSISLREWEKAVALVEQGEGKLSTMPLLAAKLNPLKSSSLLRSWRHIPLYIGDLAIVIFTGIKHTADWFVEWARSQIEIYADMFRKQVYSLDIDQETIDEAIKITRTQSRKLLEEYGIDFRFLFDKHLVERPKDPSQPPPFSNHTYKEPEPTSLSPARSSPAESPTSRAPSAASNRSQTPTLSNAPRAMRNNPIVPPPRSRDRPGSAMGHRPPPVAVPKRDGMF